MNNRSEIPGLDGIDCAGHSVVLRVDLNVPIKDGVIGSDARIRAVIPTIKLLMAQDTRVILMSHLGRPQAGEFDEAYSLEPVAKRLSELMDVPVPLVRDWSSGNYVLDQPLQLLENVRFCVGEIDCDPGLSECIASLGDVFIMDAFACAHRAHASTVGAIGCASKAAIGPLFQAEMEAINTAVLSAYGKRVAVVGGAKVSGKLELLEALAKKSDVLLLGGGILNTFLYAHGVDVGDSLCEPELADTARAIAKHGGLLLPDDVMVRNADGVVRECPRSDIRDDEQIGDIGSRGIAAYCAALKSADFVIWNGPMGIFEEPELAAGTRALATAVAQCSGYTLAGGGDTIAAIEQFVDDIGSLSYVSTAGGAFLEYLTGKSLPTIEAFEKESVAQ